MSGLRVSGLPNPFNGSRRSPQSTKQNFDQGAPLRRTPQRATAEQMYEDVLRDALKEGVPYSKAVKRALSAYDEVKNA